MEKRDVQKKYNLPEKIVFCKKCTISNQRPRITFDENGVCGACNFASYKRTEVDWAQREKELIKLCDLHRKNDGCYDVIVPSSGGKDSGRVAHELKYKYGMNPLTVTWSPALYTDIGRVNFDNQIHEGGLDNVLGTPNGPVHRLLAKLSFIHLGDNFQPFVYGQTNFPLRMAVMHKVPLVVFGENGEVEYGGDMKNAFSPTREISDHNKHYFSGLPPEFWAEHGVKLNDLVPYMAPPFEEIKQNKTEIHFYSYYKFWDPQENFYYCMENTGFLPNPERSEGTYSKYASLDDRTDGFHYYLAYIKFGLGRATSDSAHEIRDGKITREEGVSLVKKYDGEFPEKHFQEFLDYLGVTEGQFWDTIDSWRSDHVWKKEDNIWKLRNPLWDQEEPIISDQEIKAI
jgi:N-acetyl sugar amidotransferase